MAKEKITCIKCKKHRSPITIGYFKGNVFYICVHCIMKQMEE